ncbi:MAG: hypothetical protein E6J34_17950 [Chloroflexi bacterium]|nr:MAG: hypothetical protein E6J34_17950 [Chloroflexota bacterium]
MQRLRSLCRCYQSDGAIKYLGRSDQQVKIRGNRVEPGEIEQQLQLHSGVKQCVVMMREDHPGEPQLAAYLVCQPVDAVPTAQELHQFLQARLPDYMLPTHFVRISELPLTPNGKVDRRALPASDLTYLSQNEAFVAPQTPLQERLAAMWTELLHLSQVSIHDNFFLVGGHSLLAAQLMLQIQTVIGVKVPLRTLFEASTIAEMAEAIQHIQSEQIEQTANEELAQMLTALGGLSEDDIQAIFGG